MRKELRTLKEQDIEKRKLTCVVSISHMQPPQGVGWGRFLQTGTSLIGRTRWAVVAPQIALQGQVLKMQIMGPATSVSRAWALESEFSQESQIPVQTEFGKHWFREQVPGLALILFHHSTEPCLIRLLWLLQGLPPPRSLFLCLPSMTCSNSHSATGDSCLLS